MSRQMTRQEILAEIQVIKAALARNQFPAFARSCWPGFVDGWFYEDLFSRLERFYQDFVIGKRPKLKLSVPPRHGKSESVIRFCVYLMMKQEIEIIYTTYSQQQAHRFSVKAQNICRQLGLEPKGTKSEWAIRKGEGSVFRAVGRGGGLTGSGADMLVMDDMIKNAEESDSAIIRENLYDFYTTTAETRLSPRGSQLAIGTRWHKDDLLGRLDWPEIRYEAIASKDEKHRKSGESLHESRFSSAMLQERKAKMPARYWSALFQQAPTSSDTSIVASIHKVPDSFIPPGNSCSDYLSIDCAFKGNKDSDYNAVQRWRAAWPHVYCLYSHRFRGGFTKLQEVLRQVVLPSDYEILVEDKANGTAIIDVLKGVYPNIIAINPTESKVARFQACSPMFESGHVHFLESISEIEDLEEELLAFPIVANDDQVDACSQALNRIREKNRDTFDIGFISPSWA